MTRYAVSPALSDRGHLTFGGVGPDPTDLVYLGRLDEQGPLRDIYLDVTSESVVAIFGKRGSGKSYTLGVIAECLGMATPNERMGASSGRKAALLLDTLNIFWSTANPFITDDDRRRFPTELEQLESWRLSPSRLDVTVWIPRGYRQAHTPLNYSDFSIAPSDLTSEDVSDLVEVDAHSDLIGQLISEARDKCAEMHERFDFDQLLSVVESDGDIAQYYAEGTIRGARQRIRAKARLPLFSTTIGTTLEELLRPGTLSVVELGDVPNSVRTVIASVLLRRIHGARSRASEAEKQLALNTRLTSAERESLQTFLAAATPPTWVLIDEAQNILPPREVKSSEAVVTFVREGRNFGLSFALTTQQPSAVDQRILAQADTIICHKLTVAQDIARMRENLKSAEPSEVKLGPTRLDLSGWLRSLGPGKAIVTNTEFDRVFALDVRPRISPHGGTGFRPSLPIDE